ncbi:two-component system response regulator AtoC [Caldalkalibacillus uzonensis]|uniref:Two-component system response regulator AtoC n=1 Tax=Caldalkalibacillus uzonensis TaxID=353224 RepID=A0ABU0CYF2_9BACI|nr:sigma-54 dependent transcriptional regulator [Caldalkalibacillus uzonensis]MDQ0341175.1 two-component system response regulator AtoC [Caldalkalibacillus uzonensis]
MLQTRILVVDDEEAIRFSLAEGLKDQGYVVYTAETGHEGWRLIENEPIKLVFLDIRLPDQSGIELLERIKKEYPHIIVIMITAFGDTRSTVECIKKGAYDYLNKPFDLEEIFFLLEQVFERENLKRTADLYQVQHYDRLYQDRFIGESDHMKQVFKKINIVARSPETTVLIEGETGTGKELVARYIHFNSERRDKPFVDINCGSIPQNLMESELFGYEKYAFTGAGQSKKGLVELADGGTLFLDEIGELPTEMQAKLLRFLETKKIKRVGGSRDIHVDVRFVAATNRNLKEEVRKNRFRSDLYYRLNVFPIQLAPLRERREDIPALVQYFLEQHCRKLNCSKKRFTERALKCFMNYRWPGNVRELKNIIERMILQNYHTDKLDVHHLPQDLLQEDMLTQELTASHTYHEQEETETVGHVEDVIVSNNTLDEIIEKGLEEVLSNQEKAYLKRFLDMTHWNISETARLIGMSRHTLKRRIDKYFPKKHL